jgi:hypothetical protein
MHRPIIVHPCDRTAQATFQVDGRLSQVVAARVAIHAPISSRGHAISCSPADRETYFLKAFHPKNRGCLPVLIHELDSRAKSSRQQTRQREVQEKQSRASRIPARFVANPLCHTS